jgi:repressor LexA
MDPRLTERQQEVLGFIQEFSETHGVPPTVREIGGRFRVTPRAAFDHLRALAVPQSSAREVPILGRIAAGAPLLAEENREGALPLDPAWIGGRGDDVFGLRVRGESMINAHIVEGDLVLVRRQDHAQSGDIVVALVDGEATVKRFGRDGRAVLLTPEHPTMAPIVIREGEKEVRILGKVVGLVRGI